MGTWNASISGNDTYADVYDEIVRRFNGGEAVEKFLDDVIKQYSDEFRDEPTDIHSIYFAAAKAGWERGYLPENLLEKVKSIIINGDDIRAWRTLGASDADIVKREKVLRDFSAKLSSPIKKPRSKQVKFRPAVFRKGDVLSILKNDGTYGGAVVMEEYRGEYGSNLIVEADLCRSGEPSTEDVMVAPVYNLSNYGCYQFKKVAARFKVIGKVPIPHTLSEFIQSCSSWQILIGPRFESSILQCVKEYHGVSSIITIDSHQLDELAWKMRREFIQESLRRANEPNR